MHVFKNFAMIILLMFFSGACAKIPKGAQVVTPFDVTQYIGTWYEIARFDFRFERNLNNTTATYTLRPDGSIKVVNRGYDYVKKKWRQAVGTAKFRGPSTEGALKVSFFGPFYASYNVIALDKAYRYALVAGQNLDYLWILSREKTLPDEVKRQYLEMADRIGFDTRKLIWVEHE